MSAQAIDSFYVELFFKGDTKAAEEFEKRLEGVKTAAGKLVGVATAAAAGVLGFVGTVAHGMGSLNDFAEANDLSASKLAALGKVAREFDVDMNSLQASMAGLQQITGEAALGVGRGKMIFEKLGMSAKDAAGNVRGADEMLEVIADKIKGMPRPEQLAFLAKMRIDPAMVRMLKDGSAALRQMREEAEGKGLFSDEDFERADHIDKLFMRTGNALGVTTKLLATKLFPVVEKILQGFLDWYNAQRKATSSTLLTAFSILAGALELVWEWIQRVVNWITTAIKWLDRFGIVTGIASGALFGLAVMAGVKAVSGFAGLASELGKTALKMMGVTSAVTLLKAAMLGLLGTALFLIIDDLVVWAEGGDSLIKQMSEDFPQAFKIVALGLEVMTGWWVLNKIAAIASSNAMVWGFIKTQVAAWAAAIAIWAATTPLWVIVGVAALVVAGVAAIAYGVYLLVEHWDSVKKAILGAWDALKGFFGSDSGEVNVTARQYVATDGVADAYGYGPGESTSPVATKGAPLGKAEGASRAGVTSNKTVNVTGTTINVKTDKSEEVAQHLDKEVQRSMRDAQSGAW